MDVISIIIPVYKVEPYLARCLDSVLAQTYSNLEIILVDDGSPDGSGAICDAYAAKDARIKVIHKENGGVSSARNVGMDAATGSYIGFVDGDDVIEPQMYEKLMANAKQYDCDISCCQMDTVSVDGVISTPFDQPSQLLDVQTVVSDYFTNGFIKEMMYSQCNKIFKSSLLEGIRYKNYKYGEDVLFIFEAVIHANSLYYDDYIGYHYVHRENSAMTSGFSANRIDYIDAIKEIEEECEKHFAFAAEKVHLWRYRNVLVLVSLIYEKNKQNDFSDFLKQNRAYLKEHKAYLKQLPLLRKLDYTLIQYVPKMIPGVKSVVRRIKK